MLGLAWPLPLLALGSAGASHWCPAHAAGQRQYASAPVPFAPNPAPASPPTPVALVAAGSVVLLVVLLVLVLVLVAFAAGVPSVFLAELMVG